MPTEVLEPPVFTIPLQSITANDGDEVIMTCEVTGKPMPDLTWYHNNACIDKSEDFVISYTQETGICSVLIVECFPEDAGIYRCIAVNPVGEATTNMELIINEPWSDMSPSPVPPEKKPAEEEPVMEPEEEPAVEVAPPKQPEPVEDEPKKPVEVVEEDVIVPDLVERTQARRPPSPEPERSPSPLPEVVTSTTTTTTEVTMSEEVDQRIVVEEEIVPVDKMEIQEEVTFGEVVVELKAPTIKPAVEDKEEVMEVPPTPTEVSEEIVPVSKAQEPSQETIVVEVKAAPEPMPDTEVLTVMQITSEQEELVVTTEDEEITEEVVTEVVEEEVQEPPKFTVPLQPQVVKDGDRVMFKVTVTGIPTPEINWFKDQKIMKDCEDFQITFDEETNECAFVIVDCMPEDTGIYSCIATNPVGKATTTANLVVLCKHLSC